MRALIARTLQEHPKAVDALAERTVARLSNRKLGAVLHDARLAGLGTMAPQDYWSGTAHLDGFYELMAARKEAAEHCLAAATLTVARLSAEIDLAPERGDRRCRSR